MPVFSHLHVHTQFSLLDGAAKVKDLYAKAIKDQMPALAITDHGNMFGVFDFVAEAWKHKDGNGQLKVKPIVGCEFYLVEDRHRKSFTREEKDLRYHQLLLAKDELGYRNLTKLCSLGFMEGFYGKYPRIDKELIEKYHEGLIATSCCLAAEIPRTILRKGREEAEQKLKWWLDLFGDDFYIEIQRHNIEDQHIVNTVLLDFADKYQVSIIASNDTHYTEREDASAHDILLCINTGAKVSEPSMKDFSDESVVKSGGRFAFANDEFYFKSQAEMNVLFSDLPQAIDNTNEIVDKIQPISLFKDIALPDFPIPESFIIHKRDEVILDKTIPKNVLNQWEYLKHLTYEGARKRYGDDLTEAIRERIDFELHTIKMMGFAGYFLIVSDFIKYGKNDGVIVGPGRGSAAGSVVAYCIEITNIDPIKYDLLFERFLNPERASMPDIDTDFDDEGREKVLKYVAEKYGKNQVAHIITYGTMAAKTSIRDTARVMELDLSESNRLSKLVPEKPGVTFSDIYDRPVKGEDSLESKGFSQEEISSILELRQVLLEGDTTLRGKVLREAKKLEGTVRNTGIHAAGIIIAPRDISDILPVAIAKDAELLVTQYEGKIIEDAGVIKMDFLGLKTLSIIRDAVQLIHNIHQKSIDIDHIPLDDKKTFELYKKGKTVGTFQFESAGMQKYLRELKPDRFEDLIAMNALYRPGPMDYIDSFIARKHGKEVIHYDLPEMEGNLAETYGITVYQEQVMLLSQKLAGFTKGQADTLRKAMGKKQIEVLNKMEEKFMSGTQERGHDNVICSKIWNDWKKFAQYAFNKSHSTCYAYVAYQTAYLKAHYAAEYMATVLSHNLSVMDKLAVYMDECKSLGFDVLGPDINESDVRFSVNKDGNVRFGLSGISGVGESVSSAIVEERKLNGPYEDAFDLAKRVKSKQINKRVLENLARAGAFDFDQRFHRSQYFIPDKDGNIGVETLVKYGISAQQQENSSQISLFDTMPAQTMALSKPSLPLVEPMPSFKLLEEERKMVGLFLSSHPLDPYEVEISATKSLPLQELAHPEKILNQRYIIAFYVSSVREMMDKNNKNFILVTAEDKSGTHVFRFSDKDYFDFGKSFTGQSAFYMELEMKKKEYMKDNQLKTWYYPHYYELGHLPDIGKKIQLFKLSIPESLANLDNLQQLLSILKSNQGKIPVQLHILTDSFALETKMDQFKIKLSKKMISQLEDIGFDIGIVSK
jgi:DNA polymerase-3 subunit alpha